MSDFTAIAADRNFGDWPDEFQQHTFGPIDAAALNNLFLPLFVVDREVDLEKISCRCTTAGSAHAITFYKAASGTALSGGTAMGSGVADYFTANASFVDDLGADSLDTVELVMALEEEFECEIPDEEAEKITNVQQAIDYVTAHLGK